MERYRLLSFSKRSASQILLILSALIFINCNSFAQNPEVELKSADTLNVDTINIGNIDTINTGAINIDTINTGNINNDTINVNRKNTVKAKISGSTKSAADSPDIMRNQNAVSDTVKKHSAHKATLYSMALPGLGQAYNKKYWKIPIIYAGFGYLAYNISKNNKEVKAFTEAYRFLSNGDSIPPNNKYANSGYDQGQLLSGREYYMRNVELSVIFTAALYLLNVVDAAVDAHFFDYDISEDLSLNVQPIIIRSPQQPFGTGGIRLCMNF